MSMQRTPLFVRLPKNQAAALDRLANATGRRKQSLLSELLGDRLAAARPLAVGRIEVTHTPEAGDEVRTLDEAAADLVIGQMSFLEAEAPDSGVLLSINSPGGSITAGLAIYDTMQFVKPDVQTFCIGQAASMAAVLLAAGTKGKRFSLPNSRIVIHQPLMSGLAGQATDIDIAAREILRMRERINEILVHHTGQSVKRIQDDTERDYIMSADQGKEYGIIDDVIRKRA